MEDHISNLPNDIIGKILSFLITKDAVRTSILSRNWEYKWTYIQNIQIDDDDDECQNGIDSFIGFVDRTLDLTGISEISSFRLSCTRYKPQYLPLPRWISAVLERKVKYLDLKAGKVKNKKNPLCISSFSSLTELKLSSPCTLEIIPTKNCFPNLKVLYLCKNTLVRIVKDCLNSTVLTFPVLKKLELDNCRWLGVYEGKSVKDLVLSFPVLEELVLDDCSWVNIKSPLIKAPALTTFTFKSFLNSQNKFVLEAPAIYHLHLSGQGDKNIIARRSHMILLEAVRGLKFLRISSNILEALIPARPRLALPAFHQLRQLELICVISSCGAKEFMAILDVLPVLQLLTIKSVYWMFDNFHREKGEHIPPCVRSHLKEVNYHVLSISEDRKLDLAKFFLEEASNLEKMCFYLSKREMIFQRKEIETKIIRELSESRRSSKSVSIVFIHKED